MAEIVDNKSKEEDDLIKCLTRPSTRRNFVNNSYFAKWNYKIIDSIRHRSLEDTKNKTYRNNGDLELLAKVLTHIKHHSKSLTSENIVLLTHPLYTFLSHWNDLNFTQMYDANNYKNNLFNLFKSKPLINVNIIVAETLHHYADSTSVLLENGLIDAVFITEYDTGKLWDEYDLEHIKNKKIFIAGTYNDTCLTTMANYVMNGVTSQDKVYVLPELSLEFPSHYSESLKVSQINLSLDKNISFEKNLTMDDFFKMIK